MEYITNDITADAVELSPANRWLTSPELAMYTYIMERTQIYLSREQAARLDRAAKRTGSTRSHLIREAIEARYGTAKDPERIERVLRTTAGVWRDRVETGEHYVERIRTGRRLQELFREGEPESPDR